MKKQAHITVFSLGVVSVDDSEDVLLTLKFRNPSEAARKLFIFQVRREVIPELEEMIVELHRQGYKRITIESTGPISLPPSISKEGVKIVCLFPNKAGTYVRENQENIQEIFNLGKEEVFSSLYEISSLYTELLLKSELSKRDLAVIHLMHIIDDAEKILNLLFSRIREWYSLHFPEMFEILDSHKLIVRLILELERRENFRVDILRERFSLPEDVSRALEDSAASSVGIGLLDGDLKAIRGLAQLWIDLERYRDDARSYMEDMVKEVAPNVSGLVGPMLAARLLSLAGGLEALSKMPASTIQLLGAEKALFRYIRGKGTPPKHGVIFQHPYLRKSPSATRGKIARKMANKIAIAARIDLFSGALSTEFVEKSLEELHNLLR